MIKINYSKNAKIVQLQNFINLTCHKNNRRKSIHIFTMDTENGYEKV